VDVAATLLQKNLIPVLQHSNDTYAMVETEGRRAAAGLLPGSRVHVVISRSTRANALCFAAAGEYVITLTDELLRRLETAVTGLLCAPQIRQFIQQELQLSYDVHKNLPANMTGGIAPNSHRHAIGADMLITLFYDVMDNAWLFSLFHELAHIHHGDVDGKVGEATGDLYSDIVTTVEHQTYGGSGQNRERRYAEFRADREAASWLIQVVLRSHARGERDASDLALLKLILAAMGALVAVLQISHHDPDTPETMGHFDHPSFDARLEGVWEAFDTVLPQSLPLDVAYRTLHSISSLRGAAESVVLGAPSKYVIRL
jgi:hypothetical protein